VSPPDVVATIVTNPDEDWIFGNSWVQFLTGKLASLGLSLRSEQASGSNRRRLENSRVISCRRQGLPSIVK
jgi:hypothetical protein